MRALVGAREVQDERGTSDDSGAIAFCAGVSQRGRLQIEARPAGVQWGLALFRVNTRVWDPVR